MYLQHLIIQSADDMLFAFVEASLLSSTYDHSYVLRRAKNVASMQRAGDINGIVLIFGSENQNVVDSL
jgi:hypothetical protein